MSWDILPKANLQYFLSKLKDIFDQKVDKVSGKGLSTNDYTTTEKNKLAGLPTTVTDEKVKQVKINDASWHTITLSQTNNTSTETATLEKSPGLLFINNPLGKEEIEGVQEGTTGLAYLVVGNSKLSKTADNYKGKLRIYDSNAYRVDLTTETLTDHRNVSFPDKNGTIIISDDGAITIYSEGTTSADKPCIIYFENKDTTTGKTYNQAYLAAYQDHRAAASAGENIVLNPGGCLFIGSGESPKAHYSAVGVGVTVEKTYITSDNDVHIQANGNTIANRRGLLINTSGEIVPDVADTATNNSGSIGSNSYKWANGYFTKINGTNVSDYITTGNASFSTNIFADTRTEVSQLTLGNGSGATSETTSKGVIVLYSIGTKRITLMTEDSISDDRIIKFPDATGTVALNGDLNTLEGSLRTEIQMHTPILKDVTVTTDANGFANITSDATISDTISAMVLSPRRASCELWRNETTDTAYRAFVYTRGTTRTAIASQSVIIRLWGFYNQTPGPPPS